MECVTFFSSLLLFLFFSCLLTLQGRFLLFFTRFFGRFLHFFSLSSEFSFHWEKTDCFVTLFDLPLALSLSLSFTPATYTRERTR